MAVACLVGRISLVMHLQSYCTSDFVIEFEIVLGSTSVESLPPRILLLLPLHVGLLGSG